jgi:hypothetical protein
MKSLVPKFILILTYVSFLFCVCCKTPEKTSYHADNNQTMISDKISNVSIATPPVLIYKTKSDYYNNVPVTLSDDGKSIASYPDIKDVYFKGELAYPTVLAGGYLLDNRGISIKTAFLDFTYFQYSNLKETPKVEELINHIIDPDPLTELYSCHDKRDTVYLNQMIFKGQLINCKKLK